MGSETLEPAASHEQNPYEIKLDIFEGPLDLLLYLIRKDELDIYDIPVAHITTRYLGFMQHFQNLDVEQSSDFILMAATLMKIKSQMLLPREDIAGEGEEEDPREELVRRLLEYQQFKEIADWLGIQKKAQSDVYLRRQGPGKITNEGAELRPVSLFDLLKVFKVVLETVPKQLVHQIIEDEVSIESCIEHVLAALERRTRVRFLDLIEGRDRLTMISTFIGLLELLKAQRIHVQQARPFDDIWIEESKNGAADTPIEVTAVRAPPEADAEVEGTSSAEAGAISAEDGTATLDEAEEDTAPLQEHEPNSPEDEATVLPVDENPREEDETDSREDEADH
jgi:segregation and condensation protein A